MIGGIAYSPIRSSTQAAPASSGNNSDTEKIGGTIAGEIADLIQQNGIKSDVDAFLNAANSFLSRSTSLSGMSMFGGSNNNYNLRELIAIQQMANEVKFNKEKWDKVNSRLDSQDAWDEVALDSRGHMYVSDQEGNVLTVNPRNYDPEKHFALTNNQLLGLRERASNFAMNSTILNNLSGAIGMKTIQNFLAGVVEKLGTTSMQGYSSKEANDIFNGAKILMASGPDGFYKVTDKQQARDVRSALSYLKTQLKLNPGMWQTLEATIAASGGDPVRDMDSIIAEIITNTTDIDMQADFDQTATKHHLQQTGSDKTQFAQDTYLSRIAHGQGEWTMTSIVPEASAVSDKGALLVPAAVVGPIVDKNMERLPQMSLASLKIQAEAMKATIETDVTFGAQLINPEQERAILWDGSSQLTNVMLPYKNVNGRITPDFELLLNFNAFQKDLKNYPNISNFEKTALMKKYGLTGEDIVEKDGVFQLKDTMMFLTFSAYADNDNIDFTKTTERFTEKVSNSEGKMIVDAFNNAVKYGYINPTKSQKASSIGGYDTARRWDFRKGNVFIPIKSSFLGDHMSMNQYVSKQSLNRFDVRSQMAIDIADDAPTINGQFN